MANKALARIFEIDAQMALIDKALKRGEHVAAGLTVTVRIGADRDGRPADMKMELCCQTEALLQQMRASLAESRVLMLSLARHDLRDLEAMVTKQGEGPQSTERNG